MQILAIIPARGGSKGIPKKNIRRFAGKPLLAHSIKHAEESACISRIMVSTESARIAAVAKKYGAEVPFLRPAELAGDRSLVADAIVDMLEKLKQQRYVPDLIVLLQPTSPLRRSEDIDGTVDLLKRRRAPAALTVCRAEQLVFTKDKKDRLHLESNPDFLKSSNRQSLPPTYKFDGCAVYVIKTRVFLKERTFMPSGTVAYEIPRWRAVDLDEPEDFVVGEFIFRQSKALARKITRF